MKTRKQILEESPIQLSREGMIAMEECMKIYAEQAVDACLKKAVNFLPVPAHGCALGIKSILEVKEELK